MSSEKAVLLDRGGVIYELTVSGTPNDLNIEQVVIVGSEEDIDPTLFEETITHDEWTTIGEQYGRSDK